MTLLEPKASLLVRFYYFLVKSFNERNFYCEGWGKTETDAISTSQPLWTEIPVVDEVTCIRSQDALNRLTSNRTFCAGNRDGTTGPCNGDSGKNN